MFEIFTGPFKTILALALTGLVVTLILDFVTFFFALAIFGIA